MRHGQGRTTNNDGGNSAGRGRHHNDDEDPRAHGDGPDGWNRDRDLWDAWDDQAWDPETWEERHRAAVDGYEESPSRHQQLPHQGLPQRIPGQPPQEGTTQDVGRYDAPPPPNLDHAEVSAGERDTEPHWPDHAETGRPQLPPGFALPPGATPEVQYGPEPGFGGYGPQPGPPPGPQSGPQSGPPAAPARSMFEPVSPPPVHSMFEPPQRALPPGLEVRPGYPPPQAGYEQGPFFDTRQPGYDPHQAAYDTRQPAFDPHQAAYDPHQAGFDTRQPSEPQSHPEMWDHRDQWQREQVWEQDVTPLPAEPERLPAEEEKAPRRVPALLIAAIVSVLLVGVAVWTQWPKDVRGASPARPGVVASDPATVGPAAEGSTPLPGAPSDSASPVVAPTPSTATTTRKATPTPTPTPRTQTTSPSRSPSPSPSPSSSSPSPSPSPSDTTTPGTP